MATKLDPPRGTADLMPEEMARHRKVADTAREIAARFGFEEMATPIFEFTEVFARPLGESSDVVTKETYTFEDRGGKQMTLRPEGTAGIVRALISEGLTQTLPQKFFYSGAMFRYERPQKGRMRQFHQIGAELLGAETPLADAEVISLGAMVLEELKILDKCVLHVNTLGDTESRTKYRAALVEYFTARQDKLSADSKERLAKNPLRILDSKDEKDQALIADAPRIDEYLNDASRKHFDATLSLLEAMGIKYKIDSALVRGLDYYCHTAFEFITSELGAQGTVLGGGRYDGLAETLGGSAVAGVGWAAGIERMAMLIAEPKREEPAILLIALDAQYEATIAELGTALHKRGVRAEFSYESNIRKQLKRADKLGARFAVIYGEDEAKRGAIILRDMKDGSQRDIALKDAADEIKNEFK